MSANVTRRGRSCWGWCEDSRAHDRAGRRTRPAGPRGPWQAEAICPCKSYLHRLFTSTFHQDTFQTQGGQRNAPCRAVATQQTRAEAHGSAWPAQDTAHPFWGTKHQPHTKKTELKQCSLLLQLNAILACSYIFFSVQNYVLPNPFLCVLLRWAF